MCVLWSVLWSWKLLVEVFLSSLAKRRQGERAKEEQWCV